jgi:integrase
MGPEWRSASRREHIDFEAGVIRVENAWKRDKSGKRYLGPPKNGEPPDVPIPRILREELLNRCEEVSDEDFLFVGEKGGPLSSDHFRKRWFLPALRELAIRNAGIHMLRHTCASLLIRQNTPITTVSQILGHSDVQITLKTYAHFFVEDSFEAMEKLSQYVESDTE